MIIGIDARGMATGRGLGNFTRRLLAALAKIDAPHEFVVYIDERRPELGFAPPPGWRIRPLSAGVAAEQFALPRQAAADGVALLHCPANTGPLRLSPGIKLVLTIHDVMYLFPHETLPFSPSPRQIAGRLYRRLVVPRAARSAAVVTTVSECSKRDIVRWLGLPESKIRVIYEAAHESRGRAGGAAPFILLLGGIDPRKNTAGAIKAFAHFKALTGRREQLVIAGVPEAARRRFAGAAADCGVAADTRLLDYVSDSELADLYASAQALLYPSFYEGFGLPILEAMASGTPVVASRRGSIPEIAGEAALLVEPEDWQAAGSALARLAQDNSLRERHILMGRQRAALFSWEKAAREMVSAYESVAR